MESKQKLHWENAWTSKAASETSWFQPDPAVSLEMIDHAGTRRGDALIDVGGGASLLVDRLLRAGYRDLSVLDISAAALRQAQERLGERAGEVKWIESDVTCFEPDRNYRLWHDRATFHFLTEAEDRRRYVDALYRALAPGGQVIIASFAPGGPTRCSGLDIVQYDPGRLQAELGSHLQLREHRTEMHRTPGGNEQKFGFFRFERAD